MLLTVQRRRAKGLTIQGNYTLSHCIGDGVVSQPGSGGITPGFRKYNRVELRPATGPHVANISTVVESPRFANNTMRYLFSGWQLSGILKLMSGTSFRVTSGIDTTLTGTSDNGRANQVLADAFLAQQEQRRVAEHQCVRRPDAGDRHMQRSHAVVRIWKRGPISAAPG